MYESNELKQAISKDIKNSTYYYFSAVDLCFRDYAYGDKYYFTLTDVIYKYITAEEIDWDMEYKILGVIDTVELVSRLYEKYIKSDQYYNQTYKNCNCPRRKKNYIMKCLQRATVPLLKSQFAENQIITEGYRDLRKTENLIKFRYWSIYQHDNGLLDELSYKDWMVEKVNQKNREANREQVRNMYYRLNDKEKKVIELYMRDYDYNNIAYLLRIPRDTVRKILFRATDKLVKLRNSEN